MSAATAALIRRYCRTSKAALDRIGRLPCADAVRADAVLARMRRREHELWTLLPATVRAAVLDPTRED